jgi:D-arabinose 1-dehydrogenase-like Zn-dependent alcohol dehydrogenase
MYLSRQDESVLTGKQQAVVNANLKEGQWLTVIGAGGGLGHFAGQ